GTLEAIGSRQDVEAAETLDLVLEVLASRECTIDELCEATERRKATVVKAVQVGMDRGMINRTGKGKSRDPYKYSVPPFGDTSGNTGTDMKTACNESESQQNVRSGDFRDFSKGGNGMGTAFSSSQSDDILTQPAPWETDANG